jgi:hypothetical protein
MLRGSLVIMAIYVLWLIKWKSQVLDFAMNVLSHHGIRQLEKGPSA